jgi:hypothetical protein
MVKEEIANLTGKYEPQLGRIFLPSTELLDNINSGDLRSTLVGYLLFL